jgi:hypothetical protein
VFDTLSRRSEPLQIVRLRPRKGGADKVGSKECSKGRTSSLCSETRSGKECPEGHTISTHTETRSETCTNEKRSEGDAFTTRSKTCTGEGYSETCANTFCSGKKRSQHTGKENTAGKANRSGCPGTIENSKTRYSRQKTCSGCYTYTQQGLRVHKRTEETCSNTGS